MLFQLSEIDTEHDEYVMSDRMIFGSNFID